MLWLGHAFLVSLDEATKDLFDIGLVICNVVLIRSNVSDNTEHDLEGHPVKVRQSHVSMIEYHHDCDLAVQRMWTEAQ